MTSGACRADVIRNCSAPCVGRISINGTTTRNFDQAGVRLLGEGREKKALSTTYQGNDGSRR